MAITHILRYLKGAPRKGRPYLQTQDSPSTLQPTGYTDADWASDSTKKYSTSGYYVFLGSHLVTRKSKKQVVVARSSTEAEYRAMVHAYCEL